MCVDIGQGKAMIGLGCDTKKETNPAEWISWTSIVPPIADIKDYVADVIQKYIEFMLNLHVELFIVSNYFPR